ncbi:MAG: hypothetical protein LBG78_05800 [Azoarcus sp.]|jgi:hypothetical protein|nr:hypothetical protein [Azoarcus sp.]
MNPTPAEHHPAHPTPGLLEYGIGLRCAIAAAVCGLLWLAVFWALGG